MMVITNQIILTLIEYFDLHCQILQNTNATSMGMPQPRMIETLIIKAI